MTEGHELSRQQIAKHAVDRYPTPAAQFRKLLDETGELAEALIDDAYVAIRREYADVGLSLYALGNKLGLDLIECMRELVAQDDRKF